MDEQRIREIVREELAELIGSIRPTIVVVGDQQVNANSIVDRFTDLQTRSHVPKKPWR